MTDPKPICIHEVSKKVAFGRYARRCKNNATEDREDGVLTACHFHSRSAAKRKSEDHQLIKALGL